MIKEHDLVVLRNDVPSEGLKAGDVGTVVHLYGDGKGFEVEFTTLGGDTLSVVTLESDTIRPVNAREIMHARELAVG
jgi:hypothetical protein